MRRKGLPRKRSRSRAEQEPPRRRGAEQTEDELIRAATLLFSAKGYKATTIADLGAALGLTGASMYYYVSTKQELLLRVLEAGIRGFLARLEEIAETDVSDRTKLRLALENHLDFVFNRQEAVAVYLRERRHLESPYREQYDANVDRYDALFRKIVADGVASGEFPPVDAKIVSLLLLGAVNWIVEWYNPRGSLTQAEMTGMILDLLVDRLLASPRTVIS